MKKYILLLSFCVLLLTGCFDQTIIMNRKNFSGTINYSITFSPDYLSFISSHDKTPQIDIRNNMLFNKNNIQNNISNKLKLIKHEETTNIDNSKSYNITFDFDEIEEITKRIKPVFFENSINYEKDFILCHTKVNLNFIADQKKIKEQLNNLGDDEKSKLLLYFELIRFKLIYITPNTILTNQSTNDPAKVVFSSEPLDNYPAPIFESDIANKISRKEERDRLYSLYKKDKLKNIYVIKQKLDDDDKKTLSSLTTLSGFKNKAVYEYSLSDIIKNERGLEINLAHKK